MTLLGRVVGRKVKGGSAKIRSRVNFGCGTFRLFLSLTPLDGRYPLGLESNTAYYEQLLLSYKQTIQSQIARSKKRKKINPNMTTTTPNSRCCDSRLGHYLASGGASFHPSLYYKSGTLHLSLPSPVQSGPPRQN